MRVHQTPASLSAVNICNSDFRDPVKQRRRLIRASLIEKAERLTDLRPAAFCADLVVKDPSYIPY
jgi:hypothetical protein